MAYPRSQLVDAETPGFYHCVTRCVRRAFLCGKDRLTGRNFDHRKDWIENRILKLAECFAVSVYAYAVMSNHLHVVLRIDPRAPEQWPEEEIARRWLKVFPGALGKSDDPNVLERCILALTGNAKRLDEIRSRLGSLSWFMRALNEPIARMANLEDGCTGRFWEGRFKCQALLDEQAVISCMTYVDLNPIRAGICDKLEHSEHTSGLRRMAKHDRVIGALIHGERNFDQPLKPIAGLCTDDLMDMTESSYLDLVKWTGIRSRPEKLGKPWPIDDQQPIPAALWSVARDPHQWLRQVQGTESRYYRAIGSAEALMLKAAELGQRWMKGISSAAALHIVQPQQLT